MSDERISGQGQAPEPPRQKTAEEIREEFFGYLTTMAHYWATTDLDDGSVRDRIDGVIFSILVGFDGCAGGLQGSFLLVPSCNESDPDYLKANGENWWPTNEDLEPDAEISCGDMLHDVWSARRAAP